MNVNWCYDCFIQLNFFNIHMHVWYIQPMPAFRKIGIKRKVRKIVWIGAYTVIQTGI